MATQQELKRNIGRTEREEIQLEVISKRNQRAGLCKDCVRSESCSLSHNTNNTIWDCDDYNYGEVSERQSVSTVVEAKKRPSLSQSICTFCSFNENCSLKSVEGIISNCSELS